MKSYQPKGILRRIGNYALAGVFSLAGCTSLNTRFASMYSPDNSAFLVSKKGENINKDETNLSSAIYYKEGSLEGRLTSYTAVGRFEIPDYSLSGSMSREDSQEKESMSVNGSVNLPIQDTSSGNYFSLSLGGGYGKTTTTTEGVSSTVDTTSEMNERGAKFNYIPNAGKVKLSGGYEGWDETTTITVNTPVGSFPDEYKTKGRKTSLDAEFSTTSNDATPSFLGVSGAVIDGEGIERTYEGNLNVGKFVNPQTFVGGMFRYTDENGAEGEVLLGKSDFNNNNAFADLRRNLGNKENLDELVRNLKIVSESTFKDGTVSGGRINYFTLGFGKDKVRIGLFGGKAVEKGSRIVGWYYELHAEEDNSGGSLGIMVVPK